MPPWIQDVRCLLHAGTRKEPWISSEGFEFYVAAIASFLESAIDHYVDNLGLQFVADATFVQWLQRTWLQEERRHGIRLRAYVAKRWPGFAWDAAWADYRSSIPLHTTRHLNPSRTLELLSRCVTETEAAMMYRCIGECAADPALRSLALDLSRDEVGHYRVFRRHFSTTLNEEPVGLIRAFRTIVGRARLTIDRDIALAFAMLNQHWLEPPSFVCLEYPAFLGEVEQAYARYFPMHAAQHMILKPLDAVNNFARGLRPMLRLLIHARVARLLH